MWKKTCARHFVHAKNSPTFGTCLKNKKPKVLKPKIFVEVKIFYKLTMKLLQKIEGIK